MRFFFQHNNAPSSGMSLADKKGALNTWQTTGLKRTMHIILCSDNSTVREFVSDRILDRVTRLTVCESGMELLAAVRTLAADIVVLDLGTHGMGGSLLASAVRELAPDLRSSPFPSPAAQMCGPWCNKAFPCEPRRGRPRELNRVVAALTLRRKLALGVASR